MKLPKVPKVLTKVALGMGAATLAGMAVSFIAPQFAPIARPVAALAAGGIPGVAAELLINQGFLTNITSMFTGGSGGGRLGFADPLRTCTDHFVWADNPLLYLVGPRTVIVSPRFDSGRGPYVFSSAVFICCSLSLARDQGWMISFC